METEGSNPAPLRGGQQRLETLIRRAAELSHLGPHHWHCGTGICPGRDIAAPRRHIAAYPSLCGPRYLPWPAHPPRKAGILASLSLCGQSGSGADIILVVNNCRSFTPAALSMSATSPRKLAKYKAAITRSPRSSPMMARNGLAFPGALAAGCLRTGSPGSKRWGTATANFRKLGTSTARSAKSSRPRAVLSN